MKASAARQRMGAAMGHSVMGRKIRFEVRGKRFEGSFGAGVR